MPNLKQKIMLLASLPILTGTCCGHIDWTRANSIDPDCIALYHIDNNQVAPGGVVSVAAGLPTNRSLTIMPPAGSGASANPDVAQSIFFPLSFRFNSIQELRSQGMTGGTPTESITGDLSIEARFKWHSGLTSSTIVFGLVDGPKMQITYDPANPANDRLGVITRLGDYKSAPQFVNWIPHIEHDGGIGNWSHAGLCIHSTGATFNAGRQTLQYNAGSVARFYINGHLIGNFSISPVDIGGMAVAETSAITMQCAAGSHTSFDEFTIWTRDWSENGDEFGPFGDGRGSGVSAVAEWMCY